MCLTVCAVVGEKVGFIVGTIVGAIVSALVGASVIIANMEITVGPANRESVLEPPNGAVDD